MSRSVTALVSLLVLVVLIARRRRVTATPEGDAGNEAAAADTAASSATPSIRSLSRVRLAAVVLAIVVAGVLDMFGLISFSIGLERAPTWLVGLASSFGPTITIIFAVAFLGERLKRIQWIGLTGVAIGMIAIALP